MKNSINPKEQDFYSCHLSLKGKKLQSVKEKNSSLPYTKKLEFWDDQGWSNRLTDCYLIVENEVVFSIRPHHTDEMMEFKKDRIAHSRNGLQKNKETVAVDLSCRPSSELISRFRFRLNNIRSKYQRKFIKTEITRIKSSFYVANLHVHFQLACDFLPLKDGENQLLGKKKRPIKDEDFMQEIVADCIKYAQVWDYAEYCIFLERELLPRFQQGNALSLESNLSELEIQAMYNLLCKYDYLAPNQFEHFLKVFKTPIPKFSDPIIWQGKKVSFAYWMWQMYEARHINEPKYGSVICQVQAFATKDEGLFKSNQFKVHLSTAKKYSPSDKEKITALLREFKEAD